MEFKPAELFAELLRFNVGHLAKLVDGLAPESYYVRTEQRGNPLIWLLGHVVLNRGEIIENLGGDAKTGILADFFARGTKPETNPSVYPQPAQLISHMAKMSTLTDKLLLSGDNQILDRPSWGRFKNVGQNLAYSYMHETHHLGQIAYIVNLPIMKKVPKKSSTFYRDDKPTNSTTKIILDGIKSVFA